MGINKRHLYITTTLLLYNYYARPTAANASSLTKARSLFLKAQPLFGGKFLGFVGSRIPLAPAMTCSHSSLVSTLAMVKRPSANSVVVSCLALLPMSVEEIEEGHIQLVVLEEAMGP